MIKPKVTVAVAIYNVENGLLIECIESIIKQTLEDIEILLISDNTCKENLDLMQKYTKKDQRIRIIHNENNRGLAYVRNQSIEAAQGEYLCFVDQDDELDKDICRNAYFKAINSKADIVLWTYKIRMDDEYQNTQYLGPKEYLFETEQDLSRLRTQILDPTFDGELQMPMIMTAWAKLFNTEFLRKNADVRFPVEFRQGGEDYSFTYRIFGKARKILFFEEYGYIYRQIGTSMTKKYNENEWENRKKWIYEIQLNIPHDVQEQQIAFYRFCLNEVIAQCVVTQLHIDAHVSFIKRKKELKKIRKEAFVIEALSNLNSLKLKKNKYIFFLALKMRIYSLVLLLSKIYRKKKGMYG